MNLHNRYISCSHNIRLPRPILQEVIGLLQNFPQLFQRDKWKLEYTSGVLAEECKEVFMKSWFAKHMAEKGLLNQHNNSFKPKL